MTDTVEALAPADIKLARFQQVATDAVTRALVYRVSRSGGRITPDATLARAEREAAEGFTGEALLQLLNEVAIRAVENAEREADAYRWSVVNELELVAERADSLTIHRYAEALKAARR